jgi:GntR family transcriptional repressor for pyruvate dehydrogenase complex
MEMGVIDASKKGRQMKKLHKAHARTVGSKIRPVIKVSISEEIAKQIMDLISNGALNPGDRLPPERELCEEFGASRSSLREALRCLSIVGVLNARVGEGTSVAADGKKFLRKIIEWRLITERHDIENLLEVRIALEGISAANTALRGTEEDLEHLRKFLTKMKRCLTDQKAFATLDLDFHITLANISGNTLLADLIFLIRSQVGRALQQLIPLPNAIPLSHKEHLEIFEAIERHDAEMARKAMHAHLQAALLRYREATKGNRKSGSKVKAISSVASAKLTAPTKDRKRKVSRIA